MLPTFLLTLAALSTAPAETAEPVEIRLRSSATCTSSIVRLTDIADIASANARLAQALAEVPLCPAPAGGTERTLSQNDLRQLLAASGVERDDCRLVGTETVTIRYDRSAKTTAQRPLVASGVRQTIFTTEIEPKNKLVRPATAATIPQTSAPKTSAAPLVERGTAVTVVARTAGVRITASGKALDAGAAGEAINVELADTKQRILARITGPQTVEIAAP